MSIKAKFLTAVSIALMSVVSFCAMAQNSPNVALPDGWSATQDNNGKVTLQYSGNKRVKSVKVNVFVPKPFSVSATKQVFFSSGNLQYQPSTTTWRFAQHQWDYVGTQIPDKNGHKGGTIEGSDNSKIKEKGYVGWIDFFGWGTGKNPILVSKGDNMYSKFNDWGNEIKDVNKWRTMSMGEWWYLLQSRKTVSGIRYSKAIIHGVNGLVILPDDWESSIYTFVNTNTSNASFVSISDVDWGIIAAAGAVFIPASGSREETYVYNANTDGYCWSSTSAGNNKIELLWFNSSHVGSGTNYSHFGRPVRLVCDVLPKFSVSATKQVYFSQGNLQYQASSDTWRFAEHQWDYVGNDTYGNVYENGVKCNNELIAEDYTGWIDLFGWATSGYLNKPYMSSSTNSDYPHGTYNLTGEHANEDWGVYNKISNGGDTAGVWRTMTNSEWSYLISSRTTKSGKRYSKAQVHDVNGLVILPDDWDVEIYTFANTNSQTAAFAPIADADWSRIEAAGAVFLPACDVRIGREVKKTNGGINNAGCYWTTTYNHSEGGWRLRFNDELVQVDGAYFNRGQLVRLVRDAK